MTLLHQMAEIVRDLKELDVFRFWVSFSQVSKNKIIFTHPFCDTKEEHTIKNAIEEAFDGYTIKRESNVVTNSVSYTISVG